VAWTIVAIHQKLLFSMFFEVLLPGQVTFSELLPLYTMHERTIIWIGIGITVASAVLGFLGYLKDRKGFSSSFFTMTVFLLPLLAVASVFRFSSQKLNVLISHRAFEFGYITIGAFSAYFFVQALRLGKKLPIKRILICAIAVVLIIGPMTGAMHPQTFSRVSDVVSSKALALNDWMSESNASVEYTIGDQMVFLILAIYGNSRVVRHSEFFVSQDFVLPRDEHLEWTYVVTYVYMTSFYGLNATRFDGSPDFLNLYSNGLLNVYGTSNRTSS